MNIRFDQLTPTIDWTFGSHFPESSTTPIITGLDVSYLLSKVHLLPLVDNPFHGHDLF